MITTTPVMPVIAIATIATIIFVGLGFMPRPSRATAMWSASFAIAMVGGYVWLGQEFIYPEQLRAVGSALTIAPMPLIWSGLRAYRGCQRQFVPLSISFMLVAPAALFASTLVGFYGVAFRLLFCGAAVFAVLMIIELVRLGPQLRDESLPLMGVAGAFVVFAVITAVNGALVANRTVTNAEAFEFLRALNFVGITVYIVCALTTLLLLTIRTEDMNVTPHQSFEKIARNRLGRAQAAKDTWWSLLDIRLDDPDDIRLASGAAAFKKVTDRFAHDIDSLMPAEADIERINPSCVMVLVPRPHGSLRDLLAELLEQVSIPDRGDAFPARVSASVGWAPVSAVGYDFEDLVKAASEAAAKAAAKGGDRWERIHGEGE